MCFKSKSALRINRICKFLIGFMRLNLEIYKNLKCDQLNETSSMNANCKYIDIKINKK